MAVVAPPKTLVIVAHPKLPESRLHKIWVRALTSSTKASIRQLYMFYPTWTIDVAAEQRALQEHERIVLQFPFFLYGGPPLLKKWLDDVLAFRWAYGPGGSALEGKEIMVATSTGGPRESYQHGGYHNYSVEELLIPFRQIANLVGARYLKPFVLHRARSMSDAEVEQSAQHYIAYLQDPRVPAEEPRHHPSR